MESFFERDEQFTGVKGLVFIGDKVLAYRRDAKTDQFPLKIDLPGGGHKKDETPFETFQRELKEEFGLDVSKEQIAYSRRYPSTTTPGKFAWFTVAYLPTAAEATIHFGNEGLEYLLLTLEQYLAADDAWPVFQDRSRDYLESKRHSA